MNRALLILLVSLLVPTSASAVSLASAAPASFSGPQSPRAATAAPGNLYIAGTSVVLTAPVNGDFSACGGSIVTAAPVVGDVLLFAGSINSRARVAGDFRAFGGSIDIYEPIIGDLVAFGLSVRDENRTGGSVFIIAANTTLMNGAAGPVTIYGNNVSLAGDFAGDVRLVAWSHVSIAPDTVIHGKLAYEAPEIAKIPSSATVMGGVTYTNASYLPDPGTSRILALISIGFFLIVRVIGALILAGLLAGLFPRFAEVIIERIFALRPRDILLTLLLGLAISVATPIVILLLSLTFVGIGLAFLILILYALLMLLAVLYAGIVLGGFLARRFAGREAVVWHDGVLGVLILSFVSLVPFVGVWVVLLLSLFSAGALLQIFFHSAFSHSDHTAETP